MSKIRNAMILMIALLVIVFAFTACGRKGDPNVNMVPEIEITSYEGLDSLNAAQANEAILYQQKIYWEAHDVDGTVEKYAFRVVDENLQPLTDAAGNPVGVPGYSVVDNEGWVYHYMDGADEAIPLEISDQKSIWSDQVYAVINFPANVNGDSSQVISVFEVKCIDNSKEESEPARRYFKASSEIPACTVGSNRGDINEQVVGTGMVLSFNILDDDPFVDNDPDHFEFKLERRDLNGVVIPEAEGGFPADQWWTTEYENNVSEYLITLDDFDGTRAALKINNFLGGAPQDSTFIVAKAIDMAGIVSAPTEIGFAVKEGFYPNTIVYSGEQQDGAPSGNDIFALGANHFVTYIDASLGQLIPSVTTSDGTHYSTPFFINRDGNFTAVHSNDMRVYMHWGYEGEFAGNSPGAKTLSIVKDEITGNNYYSEIKYYDIRLDGEPYYYAPLPASQYNYLDDDTGKEWLRVPASNDIAQETVLTGLGVGTHILEVRAVDLQDVVDATPATFVFTLYDAIYADGKEGVLVIDDSPNNNGSPDDSLDVLYSGEYFLNGYTGTIESYDRQELIDNGTWNSVLHWGKDVFSPTDLQNFETVIYHTDNPIEGNNLSAEYDVLNLYLRNGGNMIISAGQSLATKHVSKFVLESIPLLQNYFGIELDEDAIEDVESNGQQSSYTTVPFCIGGIPETANGYNQQLDLVYPSFNPQVNIEIFNPYHALGPVSYFNEDYLASDVTVMYRFMSIEPGDNSGQPSTYEYEELITKPVGIKRVTNSSNCYIFGIPLSYMEWEQVNTLLLDLLAEIEAE
ncbi:MAG: hypothetical protein K9N09_10290 [Candidatus Cloacimonetes bacterium]|nr:hypothetical protein [Candidatus Cloacimonadota bacterium]MCF7814601.1 hypothetical protein [Candidatus Cloacimonadota bacterium]MCF7869081.1 hypothetical protein [Candidatus Cloacimonadota bacterium]MCF7884498.1 hypothetical protein [Candidatus Cloacimonadota bacterium]